MNTALAKLFFLFRLLCFIDGANLFDGMCKNNASDTTHGVRASDCFIWSFNFFRVLSVYECFGGATSTFSGFHLSTFSITRLLFIRKTTRAFFYRPWRFLNVRQKHFNSRLTIYCSDSRWDFFSCRRRGNQYHIVCVCVPVRV